MSTIQNVSQELFEQTAAIVGNKSIPTVRASSTAEKFRFYGLYKRGTVGKLQPPYDQEDTDTDSRPHSRPGMFSFEARSKYDAWLEADKLSKQEARTEYVKLAESIVGAPVTDLIAGK